MLDRLQSGLLELGEDPAAHPCDSYLAYLDLLEKWNKAYNLSGIKQKEQMLSHHVFDSLSILPFLTGVSALDVGTGAGLPGFILALARPDMHWVLLDSNQKKITFLNQALIELAPGNVELVRARLEDFRPQSLFSSIVCRALMAASTFSAMADALLDRNGRILLMKGSAVHDEDRDIDKQRFSTKIQTLSVPDLQASRHLLILERR